MMNDSALQAGYTVKSGHIYKRSESMAPPCLHQQGFSSSWVSLAGLQLLAGPVTASCLHVLCAARNISSASIT
jgi:hypothetical protein